MLFSDSYFDVDDFDDPVKYAFRSMYSSSMVDITQEFSFYVVNNELETQDSVYYNLGSSKKDYYSIDFNSYRPSYQGLIYGTGMQFFATC